MDDSSTYFCNLLRKEESKSPALAAIETLFKTMETSEASTIIGLTEELKEAVNAMLSTDLSDTSVKSATELFMRFISLAALDQPSTTFADCRKVLLERGNQFINRVAVSRQKIAKFGCAFIKDDCTILTHSYSRVVCQCLLEAANAGRSFHVYVTESRQFSSNVSSHRPDTSGYRLRHKLAEKGIPCTVIVDGAIGYIMENIDFVLVGAEGVMETGGIINKIGTFSMAICAKAMNKPVYVMAESVKFVKEYPLNQNDIPLSFKYPASVLNSDKNLQEEHPMVDYTPPQYLKLLFTDLGILTPAAVSDELIKLYL